VTGTAQGPESRRSWWRAGVRAGQGEALAPESKWVMCISNLHESTGSGPGNMKDEQRRTLGLACNPPREDGDNTPKMLKEAQRL